MATKVAVTEELLEKLVYAQARHTASLLTEPYNRFGDDWGDDTQGALDCMDALFQMYRDGANDLVGLDKWLNTPDEDYAGAETVETPSGTFIRLGRNGCDGVCPELYDLDCPALPKG